ncbi:unnamed protein product [Brassica rapa subsp. narinosa]
MIGKFPDILESVHMLSCMMWFCSGLNTSEMVERSVAWSIDRSRWSWMKKKAFDETNVLSWLLKQRSLTHRPRCLVVVITVTVV